MFELHGKVVVISGGNAGIGLGFARGIARAGGDVVIWGRREEKNAEAAAALSEFDGRVFTQTVDVSDEARVVTAMHEVVEEMGRVDGVIANAGLMTNERTFVEMSSDAWRGLLAVNQDGAFFTIREGARHMSTPDGAASSRRSPATRSSGASRGSVPKPRRSGASRKGTGSRCATS